MFRLKFSKQVKKFIEKQDKKTKQRFKEVFEKLTKNPYGDGIDTKKMSGSNSFRLRIGKYRFLYFIDKDELVIIIEKGDSRGDIYK
jgi:mRNA interferase RelE/StbE